MYVCVCGVVGVWVVVNVWRRLWVWCFCVERGERDRQRPRKRQRKRQKGSARTETHKPQNNHSTYSVLTSAAPISTRTTTLSTSTPVQPQPLSHLKCACWNTFAASLPHPYIALLGTISRHPSIVVLPLIPWASCKSLRLGPHKLCIRAMDERRGEKEDGGEMGNKLRAERLEKEGWDRASKENLNESNAINYLLDRDSKCERELQSNTMQYMNIV